MVFLCPLCSYRSDTRFDHIKHSFDCHSVEPSFYLVCGLQGCQHSFKFGSSFSSFKSHASRKHPNWQVSLEREGSTAITSATLDSVSAHPPCSDMDIPLLVPTYSPPTATVQPSVSTAHNIEDNVNPMNLATSGDCVDSSGASTATKTAAMFLLTFRERYSLPQTAIDFAVGTINGIISSVCSFNQLSPSGEIEDPCICYAKN